MAQKMFAKHERLAKHERQVTAIVEQALKGMIQTHLTMAEIIDAVAENT